MKTISVIVPIHNTQKYVKECINSICKQDYKNLEILCIDSSTDETTRIVQEIAKEDTRIRHIIDGNSSYGFKINRGIREAKGDYIGIVDSDDYIEKGMYSKLIQLAEEEQVDFVKADHSSFYTEDGVDVIYRYDNTVALPEWYGKIMSCEDDPRMLYRIAVSIWSGLYRANFLRENQILTHESPAASFQDVGFSLLTYLHAKKIYHLNESFYRYRTDNLNSSVKSRNKMDVIVSEFHWLEEQIRQREFTRSDILDALKIKKLDSYYWNFDRLDDDTRFKFAEIIKDELKEEYLDSGLYNKMDDDKRIKFNMVYYATSGFPFNLLPNNNRIALMGAGKIGQGYYLSIRQTDMQLVAWVDTRQNGKEVLGEHIHSLKELRDDYDLLVLGTSRTDIRDSMEEDLKTCDMLDDRVVWFDRGSIEWRRRCGKNSR